MGGNFSHRNGLFSEIGGDCSRGVATLSGKLVEEKKKDRSRGSFGPFFVRAAGLRYR